MKDSVTAYVPKQCVGLYLQKHPFSEKNNENGCFYSSQLDPLQTVRVNMDMDMVFNLYLSHGYQASLG